ILAFGLLDVDDVDVGLGHPRLDPVGPGPHRVDVPGGNPHGSNLSTPGPAACGTAQDRPSAAAACGGVGCGPPTVTYRPAPPRASSASPMALPRASSVDSDCI